MDNRLLFLTFAAAMMTAQGAAAHAPGNDISTKSSNVSTKGNDNDKKDIYRQIDLNPVVVTGNGHHQLLKSTTTPVHVISQSLIREAGVTDLQSALARFMPQISFSPNAMGSYLRVNGLGDNHVLILVNGRKVIGDVSGNVDLNRINMSNVKRIEILDGAASALYGSDAIGGVVNIITDETVTDTVKASSTTRVSGKGQWTQGVNANVSTKLFESHTSFFHEEADSYQFTGKELDAEGNAFCTIDPDFIGFASNVFTQRFDLKPLKNLSLYALGQYNWKQTNRPTPSEGVTGGSAYELRYEGMRWEAGAKYKLGKHALQLDFVSDDYKAGNTYKTDYNGYVAGDFARTKRQRYYETELKGVFHFYDKATTIFGADWRNDFLTAPNGDVDNNVYTLAGYLQHDMEIVRNLSATVGGRLTHHGAFGNDFSPKVSLMYAPGNFRFRAAYSHGFRSPGLDQLYYHYFKLMGRKPVITFGNKDLKAERSNYVSLSAEYSNDIFSLSVSGYMNFVKDMIVKEAIAVDDAIRQELAQEFPEATAAQMALLKKYSHYINSDKGMIKGLQVNATVNITRDLSLMANYAYTHAETKTGGVWMPLERTFKNSFTAAANYRHSWGRYTLDANLNGRFQSKTYYPSYEDAPGYGVVNFNTTHTFAVNRMFDLMPSIGVDNIFDKTDHRIGTSTMRHALYSPGRMLVVGLKVNFNK